MEFFFNKIFKNIGIDLGTANTIVYIYDKGYVVNEPSVIAFKNNSDVFSIGSEAKEMIGKTHREIKVIRPMADGVIADFTAGETMIREFIKMAEVPSFMINRIIIGVPSGITSVEKKAVIDSAVMAGGRRVFLVSEPMAAAIGVGLNVLDSNANLIVDIGGGTTDIAVINYGGIVLDNTLRIAGDEMNEAIVRFIKNRFQLRIGEMTAERMKVEHGIADESMEEENFNIKGIDYQTGLPRQVSVSNRMFLEALSGILNAIINAVISTLDQLPPELASDIIDRGIVLTGGGSLLRGLDVRLRNILNVPVSRPGNALLCVAEGTRKIMDDFDLYRQILME